MKKVLFGAIVALIAFGLWFLFTPGNTVIQRDVYARVCNDIVKSSLITPSSFEINRILSGDTELSLQQALAIRNYEGSTASFKEFSQSVTREKFERGEPYTKVSVSVKYSAENQLGGRTAGIASCEFLEEGNPTPHNRTLTQVVLDDDVLEGDRLWAFFIQNGRPERVRTSGSIELPSVSDRINYLIDPQIEAK